MENIFIEMDRLILRRMSESDFQDVAEMLKNPNVMYAWQYVFEDIDVLSWIKKNRELYKKYGLGYFLAVDKYSNQVVGQIALKPDTINNEEIHEIGYILKEKFWHMGYAREGVKAMIEYAFDNMCLREVVFEIRPENKASRRVAEYFNPKLVGEYSKNVGGKQMVHLIYKLENKLTK